MNTFFSKKNKKSIGWITKEAVILVFAAILLLATVGFFYKLQSALLSQPDDGSIANLNRLHEEMRTLIENPEATNPKDMNFFIGEGKVLIGFDTVWNPNKDKTLESLIIGIGVNVNNSIYKPFKCGNSACLCLYDGRPSNDPSKRDEKVIECKLAGFSGKNIIFKGWGNPGVQKISVKKVLIGTTYKMCTLRPFDPPSFCN